MTTAAARAYSGIHTAILAGRLEPGEALTEAALAEIAGVSRTPVREALRQLEAEGLIARSATGRLSVRDWDLSDLSEHFTLRAMLEGHAAARAAARISDGDLARLRACNDRIALAVSAEPDVAAFLSANRLFHDIILEAAASERTAIMIGLLVEQPLVRATVHRYDRALFERSHSEHADLITAMSLRDPEWARSVMTGHIRRAYHALAKFQQDGTA
ncbi:GntR family transcriptional regulator [Pacificimonas sp. WHA3]|uniref:GntR family transcriptional regulator n=1 Tax=Pacificimonas pallii TaxID=2827236 RepID=A0ABS6SFM0_9SPHN|nr:GntR family transcriptional regulator [Pacificimonas pallii]MBV7257197.1 GntR family transcriptional regulator [Pacificimonas pallii]